MFCSEILNLHLQPKAGRERTLKANLEEIWPSGALFQTDARISPETEFSFMGGGYEFRGHVIARKLVRGLGYFVEMRFDPSHNWSEKKYRPQHFFNPLVLLANRIFETTLRSANAFDDNPVTPYARPALMTSIKSSALPALWN
jgi:hypothetical protein